MKIRVDGVSFKEFNEYINRTIVKTGSMYVGALMLIALCALVFGLYKGGGMSPLTPVLWFLLFIIIIQILLKICVRFVYERSGLSGTRCTYVLDDAGLDIKMGKTKGDLSWSYVKKVIETQNCYVIKIPKGTLIMPKHCMDTAEFVSLVTKRVPGFRLKFLKKKVKRNGKQNNNDSE